MTSECCVKRVKTCKIWTGQSAGTLANSEDPDQTIRICTVYFNYRKFRVISNSFKIPVQDHLRDNRSTSAVSALMPREIILISTMLTWKQIPFWDYSKGGIFSPTGCKFFPLRIESSFIKKMTEMTQHVVSQNQSVQYNIIQTLLNMYFWWVFHPLNIRIQPRREKTCLRT